MKLMEDVKIAPSVLSADLLHLEDELAEIESADCIHVDVMDGNFVPNLTFGPVVLRAIKSTAKLPIEAHLMIQNPDEMLDSYLACKADYITFHIEATNHANRLIKRIHDAGLKAGICLNPATPVFALEEIIEDVELVLVMAVNPGFSGQTFIEKTLKKIQKVRALASEHKVLPLIEVDGGITSDNIAAVVQAGADMVVAGSSVYDKKDRAKAISQLREAGRLGATSQA